MLHDPDEKVRARLREAWDAAAPTAEERDRMDARMRELLAEAPTPDNVVRLPVRTITAANRRAASPPRKRWRVGVACALVVAAALVAVFRARRAPTAPPTRDVAVRTPRESITTTPAMIPEAWGARLLTPSGRLEGRLADGRREAVLVGGAAEFTGRHETAGPFRVSVPSIDLVVEPLGTRFVVDATSDHVRVEVQDGIVQVTCHRSTRPSYIVMSRGESKEFPLRCDDDADSALALYRAAQRLEARPPASDGERRELIALLGVLLERYPNHAAAPHAAWMKGRALCALGNEIEGTLALVHAQSVDAHLRGDVSEVCRAARSASRAQRNSREPDPGGP